MGSRLVEVPLGLHLEFPGYRPLEVDLSALPCQALAADLAQALLERTNTTGPIKSPVTVGPYRDAIASFVRWLAPRGFTGGAASLTETLVFDYWRAANRNHEMATRTLLAHLEEHAPATLAPELVRQLRGVRINLARPTRPREPLSAAETARVVAACRHVLEATETAMAGAEELLGRGRDPTLHGWREEANLAWLLDREGPQPMRVLAERLGLNYWELPKPLRARLVRLHHTLFLTNEAVVACAVLVGLETGIPPEGLVELTRDCLGWVGPTDARISWFKARGGGAQSHVFVSRGSWSPGRLVERWLALSERPRRFAPDPSRLWLCADRCHLNIDRPRVWSLALDHFVARHRLLDDDGAPLRLRFSTLRPTYFARHDRRWNGALRIDPNHSSRVEGDHYLAQTRATEPMEATVEAAQRDALRRADAAPLTVLSADELARLSDDVAAAGAQLRMTPQAAGELLAGERDVFIASCKDFHHSPHAAPGSPCPVPVWVCLTCPLAVFVPSKVPNLLRLRDHLEEQWRSLPTSQWLALYGAAHVRLERDVLPRFSAVVIEAARAALGKGDDADAYYLRPEERPWPT